MNATIKLLAMLVCTLPLSAFAGTGQEKHLSLDEALELAVQNNRNIRMSAFDRKISNAGLHQMDAIFLPHVSVGYTAMVTNNPLNAFGFLLQQESVTAADFDPAKLNSPGASRNYGASVDVKLPLLNVDMIYARRGAKMQQDIYRYKEQYMKDYIRFEVQKAYTQLQFAYRARNILQSTLQDVNRIYRSVQDFHQQGLVQKSDVLNAQVQVNTVESALAKAESNIVNASQGLALLMDAKQEGAEQEVFLTDSLEQHTAVVSPVADFLAVRPDILAMQRAVDASDAQVKSSLMNFVPKVNAFASYQFNDAKLFRFEKDSYLAGISLSWTIFSGNQNRSKLRSAVYQRDKMRLELDQYMDKSRLEADRNTRELNDLQTEIAKQETSVEQAAEALRILTDRYEEGLVSTTDLLASQAQLSQQQLGLAQAVMAYNIAKYYQELLTTTK